MRFHFRSLFKPFCLAPTSRAPRAARPGRAEGGEDFGSGENFSERGGAAAPPPPPQNARKPNKTRGWTLLGVVKTAKKLFSKFFLFGLANGQEVW